MPTRADIIANTTALSRSETVELSEFLTFLKDAFRECSADGEYFCELNVDNEFVADRSYRCTPIIAESLFLLVVLESGTYLVHAMNPAAARKLIGVDLMYRKKPASRLSRTAAHCHVISIAPLTLQFIDLSVFLGKSLLTESWNFRLRVAQVELNFARPEGSVKLEFAPRYRISEASDVLRQSVHPTLGLYLFRDDRSRGQDLSPVLRWIGSVADDAELDLFGKDNVEYQIANWMRTSACPEPRISHYQAWRDDVDKACFGADWLSYRPSSIDFTTLQQAFADSCPDFEQPPRKRPAFVTDST